MPDKIFSQNDMKELAEVAKRINASGKRVTLEVELIDGELYEVGGTWRNFKP